MKQSPRARKFTNLPDSINRQLNMYALAATVAGVSLLALTPAEAKIIYTKANIPIPPSSSGVDAVPLSLTRDGDVDFLFWNYTYPGYQGAFTAQVLVFPAETNNAIREVTSKGNTFAAALKDGVEVGTKHLAGTLALAFCRKNSSGSPTVFYGPWIGVKERDLGLKFHIKGRTHYAWARIRWEGIPGTEYIVGYAYETIPNRPIITGNKGPDVITMQPDIASGSLGRLALGRK